MNPQALQIDPRWIRPSRTLPAAAGSHRFVWDLHYPPPEGSPRAYPISAVWGDTPSGLLGPAVLPGTYTVRLTAGGKSVEQLLVVTMNPRVTTPAGGLGQQFRLSMACYEGMAAARTAVSAIQAVRRELDDRKSKAAGLAAAIDALDAKLAALEGPAGGGERGRTPSRKTRGWDGPPGHSAACWRSCKGPTPLRRRRPRTPYPGRRRSSTAYSPGGRRSGRKTWPTSTPG